MLFGIDGDNVLLVVLILVVRSIANDDWTLWILWLKLKRLAGFEVFTVDYILSSEGVFIF